MIYTFPAIKFIYTNTLAEQDDHIRSEFMEWMKATGEGELVFFLGRRLLWAALYFRLNYYSICSGDNKRGWDA